MGHIISAVVLLSLLLLVGPSCAQAPQPPTLKGAIGDRFLIGAAIHAPVLDETDPALRELVRGQFDSVTSTNMLKWGPFNPRPGQYNYDLPDRYVKFGNDNQMYVVGHVLFWHNQTPNWVFEDDQGEPLTREQLLQRMRERVKLVAQRYGDRIDAWDVVNESILSSGKLRDSKWTQIIGDDFIEQAFRIADEQLPKDVELIYNDYAMTAAGKRSAVVKMIADFKAKGVRIDGVGMQGHWSLTGPSIDEIEKSITAFAKAGVGVHITELDIDVLPRHPKVFSGNADVKLQLQQDPKLNPYTDGLPDAVQEKLARRYADIFALFIKHSDKIKRVTFWGTTDKHSWLSNWPIKGRTNYPLLFDRQYQPKPAYQAVIEAVGEPAGQ